MMCFARIGLEFILQEEHELTVRIYIKEKADSIFPKSGGFMFCERPGEFSIVIFNDVRKQMGYVLAHEIVHVKQYLEDGFRIDYHKGQVFWKNRFHMRTLNLIQYIKEDQQSLYDALPWEAEASGLIAAIVDNTEQRLVQILAKDATMAEFMNICQSQKTYSHYSTYD